MKIVRVMQPRNPRLGVTVGQLAVTIQPGKVGDTGNYVKIGVIARSEGA